MIVVVSGRAQGKTTAAIRWLMEQPEQRVLLVADEKRKRHLLSVICDVLVRAGARFDSKFWSRQVVTPYDYERGTTRGRAGAFGSQIGIENLEDVLPVLFQARVEFVTCNAALLPIDYIEQAAPPALPLSEIKWDLK